ITVSFFIIYKILSPFTFFKTSPSSKYFINGQALCVLYSCIESFPFNLKYNLFIEPNLSFFINTTLSKLESIKFFVFLIQSSFVYVVFSQEEKNIIEQIISFLNILFYFLKQFNSFRSRSTN